MVHLVRLSLSMLFVVWPVWKGVLLAVVSSVSLNIEFTFKLYDFICNAYSLHSQSCCVSEIGSVDTNHSLILLKHLGQSHKTSTYCSHTCKTRAMPWVRHASCPQVSGCFGAIFRFLVLCLPDFASVNFGKTAHVIRLTKIVRVSI